MMEPDKPVLLDPPAFIPCRYCRGTGISPLVFAGEDSRECPDCEGRGVVLRSTGEAR